MAKSPADFSDSNEIAFGAAAPVPTGAPGSGVAQDFSAYDEDVFDPTTPASGEGFRSKLWAADAKDIGTDRSE